MLDRVVLPENRAELPVHGMEMYTTKGNASISQIRSPLGQSMLSPVSPVSPLGSGGLAGRAVGSISPVGGGIALESIVGMALEGGRSLGQGPFRDGFRSAALRGGLGVGVARLLRLGLRLVGSRARVYYDAICYVVWGLGAELGRWGWG
jgi:hypothetical protein